MLQRTYLCIDLKSFYASVECLERGLDPMTTNLVVADLSRTEKTICLAVTPSLKAYGISGRARLFEVVQRVKEVNAQRKYQSGKLEGEATDSTTLSQNPNMALGYIVAPPRMAHYLEYSHRVYACYLKYISQQDIHVYSIDEVFMDVTPYLETYGMTAHQLAKTLIQEVYNETGVTATAGLGSNLYLAKIAMDIMAKKTPPDEDGVRIASLDEDSYRHQLWSHQPITDFWRVGRGYAKRLAEKGMHTMGDIALCSVGKSTEYYNEKLLYDLFGINAELLIDHAWGWEPCQMHHIKEYKPRTKSLASGQVLHCAYDTEKARIVVGEMADRLALDLMTKGFMTNHVTLQIGYDRESLTGDYRGAVTKDAYGRSIPKHGKGATKLERYTHLATVITKAVLTLYDEIVNPKLLVRRMNLSVDGLLTTEEAQEISQQAEYEQTDLFGILEDKEQRKAQDAHEEQKQAAIQKIQVKYGKNAILRGSSLMDGATAMDRNRQIGGHKA
ncbi:DNA methylase [Bengtsoniella intestinalis]|uniref:Y-family DNA polymerase n=1 Tax=Bengtsoniella intestinalis TaxID=3073143 RepID=UPI00391F81E5